jgi:hypothetical protein
MKLKFIFFNIGTLIKNKLDIKYYYNEYFMRKKYQHLNKNVIKKRNIFFIIELLLLVYKVKL